VVEFSADDRFKAGPPQLGHADKQEVLKLVDGREWALRLPDRGRMMPADALAVALKPVGFSGERRLAAIPELPPPPRSPAGKNRLAPPTGRRGAASLSWAPRGRCWPRAIRQLPAAAAPTYRLGLYWPLAGEAESARLAGKAPARPPRPALLSGLEAVRRVLRYEAWDPSSPCGRRLRIPAPAECPGAELFSQANLALLLVRPWPFDAVASGSARAGGWLRPSAHATGPGAPLSAVNRGPGGCQVGEPAARSGDLPFDGWLRRSWAGCFQPVEACCRRVASRRPDLPGITV